MNAQSRSFESVERSVANMSQALASLAARVEELAGRLGEGPASPPSQLSDGAAPKQMPKPDVIRTARAPLPDPRLVRRIIRNRQSRAKYIDDNLFGDPAWDMMLDLTAARSEHVRVSVTSLCIASGVPATTALRWISQMVNDGWFNRMGDQTDKRRAFVELSDKGSNAMARYFAETDPLPHG